MIVHDTRTPEESHFLRGAKSAPLLRPCSGVSRRPLRRIIGCEQMDARQENGRNIVDLVRGLCDVRLHQCVGNQPRLMITDIDHDP